MILKLSKRVESRTLPQVHTWVSFPLSHTNYMLFVVCLKEGGPLVEIQNLNDQGKIEHVFLGNLHQVSQTLSESRGEMMLYPA